MKTVLLTPLALALFGAGVAAAFWRPYPSTPVLVNGVLLLLLLVDLLLSPRKHQLAVKRRAAKLLRDGENTAVEVEVRALGRRGGPKRLKGLIVCDEIPAGFNADRRLITSFERSGQAYIARYLLTAPGRGDYRFGAINLRCRGPLNLVARQYSFLPQDGEIKVFPALGLPRQGLAGLRAWQDHPGQRVCRPVSPGTEFESLREYVPDDDYRHINWKATARRGKPASNQYQVEQSQNLLLVFEAGRMMLSTAGKGNKLDYALRAGLMLALAAAASGDRVGAMAFSRTVTAFLPPSPHRGQAHRIARSLYNLQAAKVEPDYREALAYLAARQKKRSLVCLFTDIIDLRASAALLEGLVSLSRKHLVLLVIVSDGFLKEVVRQDILKRRDIYRKAAAEQFLLEKEQGLSFLRNRGVEVLELTPGSDPLALVNRYLELKGRLRL